MTQALWPFKPLTPFIETLEWLTDILPSKSGEQRIALREAPRRIFTMEHSFTEYEYAAALGMLRAADTFMVPDWAQRTHLGVVAPGSDVVASVPDVEMSPTALLFDSLTVFEPVTIAVDSTGEVVYSGDDVTIDEVTLGYSDARLMPTWESYTPEGLSATRQAGGIVRGSIAFQVLDNAYIGETPYTMYRGHDVMPTCPVVGGSQFSESLGWELSAFDNQLGKPYYLQARDYPDMEFQMRWHEFTRAGVFILRQWLHTRRGRQKAFWLSTRARDMEPAASISGTTVTVYSPAGLAALGREGESFDIDITATNGTSYYRQVTDVSVGINIDGRPTADLTIDSTLSLPVGSIKRISFFRCCRFNADRIELEHAASGGTSIQVPCIEIPVP